MILSDHSVPFFRNRHDAQNQGFPLEKSVFPLIAMGAFPGYKGKTLNKKEWSEWNDIL